MNTLILEIVKKVLDVVPVDDTVTNDPGKLLVQLGMAQFEYVPLHAEQWWVLCTVNGKLRFLNDDEVVMGDFGLFTKDTQSIVLVNSIFVLANKPRWSKLPKDIAVALKQKIVADMALDTVEDEYEIGQIDPKSLLVSPFPSIWETDVHDPTQLVMPTDIEGTWGPEPRTPNLYDRLPEQSHTS